MLWSLRVRIVCTAFLFFVAVAVTWLVWTGIQVADVSFGWWILALLLAVDLGPQWGKAMLATRPRRSENVDRMEWNGEPRQSETGPGVSRPIAIGVSTVAVATTTVFVPELLWVEASLGAVVVLLYGAAVVTALWHQDPVRRLDARLVMALMTGRSYLHKGGEEHVAAVEPPEATRDEGTGTPPSGSSGQ